MNFPADEIMHQLKHIATCLEWRLFAEHNTTAVRIDDWRWVEISGETIDELLAREWLWIDGDEFEVTEKGLYWLARWMRKTRAT